MENNVNILLVEDNPDDAELVIIEFKKSELLEIVHLAKDGAEALEYLFGSVEGNILREDPPKIVLLDLNLPKIDGIEVLEKIKSHPEAKKLIVIVFTSSNDDRKKLESLNLNADNYINKPMNMKYFPEAVQQIALSIVMKNKNQI